MKKTIAVLTIVALLLAGCGKGLPTPDKAVNNEPKYSIILKVDNSCPEGYEQVKQTVYGVYRRGCYPIDFDYEKANEKLLEHLIERGNQ